MKLACEGRKGGGRHVLLEEGHALEGSHVLCV